eukprot:scaffold1503_cov120-Isochrysis_galbana.AAC.9
MARTAIRHSIYSAAAAQSRFPASPHPQEPMRFQVFCVFRMTVIRPGYIFRTHLHLVAGSGGKCQALTRPTSH